MKSGKTLGFALFIGGLLLLAAYGIIQGFEDLLEALDTVSGLLLALTIIGFAILIVSIIIEQRKGAAENLKDINKEDLKP